jgi:hypothetical protein
MNKKEVIMKIIIKFFVYVPAFAIIFSMLTGCAANHKINLRPSDPVLNKTLNQEISGKWQVIESNARFIISFIGNKIHVEGWDSSDGEKFKISHLEWNGRRLKCTFIMPSTGKTRHSDLLLIDKNILKGNYKGDVSGEEIWKRE